MNLARAQKVINSSNQLVWLGVIALFGFILRTINLNYNSPFSDEAIYVVVGKLGIFGGDWFSYNAGNWLSGSQYIYPSLSALAYTIGGILGSRMLSVLSGTALIVLTFFLSLEFAKNLKHKITAALISTLLVAGSTTALYVSRLATMDMVSFAVFFSGLLILQKSINKPVVNGKKFFVASMLMFLAALIKLSVFFYFPLIMAYGLMATSGKQRGLFISYFILPITVSTLIYTVFNLSSLKNFALLQAGRGKSQMSDVLKTIVESYKYLAPIAVIGGILAKFRLSFKSWIFLIIAGSWMSFIHLGQMRVATLDKHLVFGVVFFAILAGIGISFILEKVSNSKLKVLVSLITVIALVGYLLFSYQNLSKFNNLWVNTTSGSRYLDENVTKGDKVLTESGAATILTLFPKTGIENINTFDYLKYEGIEGEAAYAKAVEDGYFQYIELQASISPKAESNVRMHDLVVRSMDTNYDLIYEQDRIQVYKRAF